MDLESSSSFSSDSSLGSSPSSSPLVIGNSTLARRTLLHNNALNNEPPNSSHKNYVEIFRDIFFAAFVLPLILLLLPLQPIRASYYSGQLVYLLPYHLLVAIFASASAIMVPDTAVGLHTYIKQRPWKHYLWPPLLFLVAMLIIPLVSMKYNAFPIPLNELWNALIGYLIVLVSVFFTYTPSVRNNPLFRADYIRAFIYVGFIKLGWFVFCMAFLVLFYFVSNRVGGTAAIFVTLGFQVLDYGYRTFVSVSHQHICSTINVHTMPTETIYETASLAMLYIDLSTSIFLTLVFPVVRNYQVAVASIVFQMFLLSLQPFLTSPVVQNALNRRFPDNKIISSIFNTSWPYHIRIIPFFLFCLSRILAGLAYCILAPFLHLSYNSQYYPLFHNMSSTAFVQTMYFAVATIVASSLVFIISARYIIPHLHKDKINLFALGIDILDRWRLNIIGYILGSVLFPFVALVAQGNILVWATSFFPEKTTPA